MAIQPYYYPPPHLSRKNRYLSIPVSEIKSWRGSGGLSSLFPIAVPLAAVVDAGQGHHALGVLFIPSHPRAFPSFRQAATNGFRRPTPRVIARSAKTWILRHVHTRTHILPQRFHRPTLGGRPQCLEQLAQPIQHHQRSLIPHHTRYLLPPGDRRRRTFAKKGMARFRYMLLQVIIVQNFL